MSYTWLQQGPYAEPPEMPPPTGERGYEYPPEMPPVDDDDEGYAWPPEMPPPGPEDLPAPPQAKPQGKEAGVGIGLHTLIVIGIFGGLGYYYFVRR